jgi:hypothetical protein
MTSWRKSFRAWRSGLTCAGLLVVAVAVACSSGGGALVNATGPGDAGADTSVGLVQPGPDASALVPDASLPALPDAAPPLEGSDDAGLPPPPNLAPAPTLTSITPAEAIVGTTGPTLDCLGTGFVARSVVQVNGTPLATTFVSPTELRAAIPKSDMAPVGTLEITVGTAPPGGGGSNVVPFQVVNPSPTVTSLTPTSALLGAGATLLTVVGAQFVSGATIAFNGAALPTTLVDPKTATATIPAAALATSGLYPVTVTNPTPGGGTSASIAFIVSNPSVTVTQVTPSTLTVNGPATSIAITGTGFVAASSVSFNGAAATTTYVSATHLGATVPASALLVAGSYPVAVTNPPPGGGVSAPFTVSVVYPGVTASSLAPSSVVLGGAPPTVTVTGSGFISGVTTIAFDGAPAPTTVIDASHAKAPLTTSQVASARTLQVTVANPAPGGGTSSPLVFSVTDPVPATASVSPSSALVGAADTTVTIKGDLFVPLSTALLGSASLATTFVDAKTLTAVIPAASLATPGSLSLFVSNPAPGGGTSTPALSFVVDNPLPTATSVAPSFGLVGAADAPIVVTGASFVPSSTVLLGTTPLATTFVGTTTLNSVIPAANLSAAATLSLSVSTPAPGGGASGALGFTVANPGPTITTVSPASVIVPAASTPITVSGTGFVSASVVQVGGTAVATTYAGGSLDATLSAAQLSAATTLSITVANPAPGGGTSNVAFFTANDPVPVLTSVSPTTLYALSGATPITLTGTGFVAASVVQVNGAPATITAQSATSMTATVPAAMLAAPGTITVSVTNPAPGGGTSATSTISVGCNISSASVVLTALGAPKTLSLNFASAPNAYRITSSELNDACPSADDTTGVSPYLGYVVVNDTAASATLSAWAVCSKTDDAFLTFYNRSTVPTTQAQLEACTDYVAEGSLGAGGHASPQSGGSSFCPGLTKATGDGLTLAVCATAVVLVQPYSTTSTTYTPPTTLTLELQ